MRVGTRAVLGIVAAIVLLAAADAVQATLATITVDKCLAAKLKADGKDVSAQLGCHAKAAAKSVATDPTCLDNASTKMVRAFAKRDDKGTCALVGDGPDRDMDATEYALAADGDVGHAGKCDGAKSKLVGKYVAALMTCYSRAASKNGSVDAGCVAKAGTMLGTGIAKAELKPPCSHLAQGAALQDAADSFVDAQTCLLNPGNAGCPATPTPTPTITPIPSPTSTIIIIDECGDGLNTPGENCDESADPEGWARCGSDFTCINCNCACPASLALAVDAGDPASILDLGWTGVGHRKPVVSNGDLTVSLSCPAAQHPCGTCSITGPIANVGVGELDSQRCSNDTSISCTSDAPCASSHCVGGANEDVACSADSECPASRCSGVGTCEFYLGPPLPFVGGGIGSCEVSQLASPVSGTANLESGTLALSGVVALKFHTAAVTNDTPCATCDGDAIGNDGIAGGTCTGGSRHGKPCDGNGTVPGRPDFGTTSFDCPPPNLPVGVIPIDLGMTTGTTSKAITTASPLCTAGGLPGAGTRCACDTCNNVAAQPCDSNADCPPSGGNPGICGGRRCIGGPNTGAPCVNATSCPGGGSCARPGEPTRPNSCVDDCTTPIDTTICADTAPTGDNVGECLAGPPTGLCSASSGHPQRSCSVDQECCDDSPNCVVDPVTPGECVITNRLCFLPTITGTGMADVPVQDEWSPTLATVFCVGPTSAPTINVTAGLPGPARLVVKTTAVDRP